MTIMKNDIFEVAGGIFSSPTASTQISHVFVMSIQASDMISACPDSPSGFACKIQVKNHTSYAPVIELNGVSGAGSATPDTVASLSIILMQSLSE
jgi:hypothetical protein